MTTMIRLPVSIGEAIDKLTILDIKCKRITDESKRVHCKREYDLLYTDLHEYVSKCQHYYKQLYDINDEIWVMQDTIRDNPDPQKCVDILDKNDMRYRVKHIINQLTDSYIREQKGYTNRRALVISHLGLGDHIGLIGAIRYIALNHDETVVVCKQRNAENVASFFIDNPSIKLWIVPDIAYIVHPSDTSAGKIVNYSPVEWTNIYESGFYCYPHSHMNDLPCNFYRDMKLDPAIRHTYFHIPTHPEATELYTKLQGQPYIFVQQVSSDANTNIINWDINEILTIDPNVNVYPEGHTWHALAQEFVNKPFVHYTEVIKHAKEIHTVDSSFYCLACYLPLDADVKKCYSRSTGNIIEEYQFS